jgi:hypothetical protein
MTGSPDKKRTACRPGQCRQVEEGGLLCEEDCAKQCASSAVVPTDERMREVARKWAKDMVDPVGGIWHGKNDPITMQNIVRQEEIIYYAMVELLGVEGKPYSPEKPTPCHCPRNSGGPHGSDDWMCNRPSSPGCQKSAERKLLVRGSVQPYKEYTKSAPSTERDIDIPEMLDVLSLLYRYGMVHTVQNVSYEKSHNDALMLAERILVSASAPNAVASTDSAPQANVNRAGETPVPPAGAVSSHVAPRHQRCEKECETARKWGTGPCPEGACEWARANVAPLDDVDAESLARDGERWDSSALGTLYWSHAKRQWVSEAPQRGETVRHPTDAQSLASAPSSTGTPITDAAAFTAYGADGVRGCLDNGTTGWEVVPAEVARELERRATRSAIEPISVDAVHAFLGPQSGLTHRDVAAVLDAAAKVGGRS